MMAKQSVTDAAAASSRPWSALPLDLLRDISRRLHVAGDYVRFHAACKPWRDTLPPAPCRPAFLPWLLSRRDGDAASGHLTARCVFSPRPSCTIAMRIPEGRWVISADDGAAAWVISGQSGALVDPLGGPAAIPLPSTEWTERAAGAVSGDGTILLYAFGRASVTYRDRHTYVPYEPTLDVALLHPGGNATAAAAEWTLLRRSYFKVFPDDRRRCGVAYHNGKVVACADSSWWYRGAAGGSGGVDYRDRWRWMSADPSAGFVNSSHVLESGGELLSVFVHVSYSADHHWRDRGTLASALTVSVYALRDGGGGGEPRWVERDGLSVLGGRVLFLGRPSSFAVDAAPLGMAGGGGCAYFVPRRGLLPGRARAERCCVYRYSFLDGEAELVDQLPADWDGEDCMWLTPRIAIAPTVEIIRKRAPTEGDQRQTGIMH